MLKRFIIKMPSKDKNITCISISITLDYWHVSHSKRCQCRIKVAHLFCHKIWPFLRLFVNIGLKLKLPINVRSYFNSSKVRGEGNSLYFSTGNPSRTRLILLIIIVCEILLFIFIFYFWKLKSNMCAIGALNNKNPNCI